MDDMEKETRHHVIGFSTAQDCFLQDLFAESNLLMLSTGKVLSLQPVPETEMAKAQVRPEWKSQLEALRDYLEFRSNHNAVCRSVSEENSTIFYSQVKTPDDCYRISFDLAGEGILQVRGSIFENAYVVAEPYRYAVAEYLNQTNSEHKYGMLSSTRDGVSSSICISLWDGEINDETVEFCEQIVLNVLDHSMKEVESLGSGRSGSKEEEDKMEKLAELLKRLGTDEDKKTPDASQSSGAADDTGFAAFLKMLGGLEDEDDEISMSDYVDCVDMEEPDEDSDGDLGNGPEDGSGCA